VTIETEVTTNLQKLSELFEEALAIARADRAEAEENYQGMKEALIDLREAGLPMSEEGELEKACNSALKIQIDSSKRLDSIIQSLLKMNIAMENNKIKLVIAEKFVEGQGGAKKIEGPANFRELTKD